MDPNANLEEQLRIAAYFLTTGAPYDPAHVARLAELVSALDEWIALGGFLPKAWERKGLSETQLAARRHFGWDKP